MACTVGETDVAFGYFQDALSLYRGVLGKDHAISSKPLTKIGAYFIQNRKHEEAMKLLQEALQLYYDYDLPDDLICAEIHFNIGIVYCETGELEKAIDSYEISLQIRRQKLGNGSVEIAQVSSFQQVPSPSKDRSLQNSPSHYLSPFIN